ncbi:DUF3883 domain-containing protein [Methanofollis aquaemaris]|uniref:DUF3883 domain-containing protein n=1 Tax=Methanofollis aquaemaris TaxID=126734 RepID=A0A8A3S3B3_9EURY|nr:helicase-related protein [Methanofollis aquaemaris]QSZ66150.1 DUF3883 domain-containing protein [Methanofollis aquaemaris]
MGKLEDLKPGATVKGILSDSLVTVVSVRKFSDDAVELTYKDANGNVANLLLYRSNEPTFSIAENGQPWSFDANPALFKLASEARRIQLAYLFDPLLAVHTSLVEPLPHQITAVYDSMLSRQPLRFLLADDPGAGKTIMAGLLIKELIARGDLQRCMIVCPGNLVEQWQDEMDQKFHVPFEILTRDKIEASRTGNWFSENPLAICRLDQLSRSEDIQNNLKGNDWDLVICDEAHKMSATYYGKDIKPTKRYKLGRLLSSYTRNFLLLTATPHNGKEADFQLFMALLDSDRFEGHFRDGVHAVDTSDLMRRLVKEEIVKFDGKPLFPERYAYTVNYTLSDAEAALYEAVTSYVRTEFNRAENLEKNTRLNVGFALTVLQRRLASSPEAIYHSLIRRKKRLEKRVTEKQLPQPGEQTLCSWEGGLPSWEEDNLDDELEGLPDYELEKFEDQSVDRASAAGTIEGLREEIRILNQLEKSAKDVCDFGVDRKWEELSQVLQDNPEMFDAAGNRRKIIIFSEHRDTVLYLQKKIRSLLGHPEAVVTIMGGMGREQRKNAEMAFTQDKNVVVLVATDAAGEGINLQRAHLMVNYDLPWNPNRIEQRFGRIHRIGQTEVCHLWNLVASNTREGEVYRRLLEKLNTERNALGGRVFDVLGRVTFEDKPLRKLLIDAIRYGNRPDVREKLNRVVDSALDRKNLANLLEERALAHDSMDTRKVQHIRKEMERADARRLQPHYIEAFFLAAFHHLGGTIKRREAGRYEISRVPSVIRTRNLVIGARAAIISRYERITFDKNMVNVLGKPKAEFVCPGHPLLDTVIDVIQEQNRDLLRQGTVLVDEANHVDEPRIIVVLEHSLQDGKTDRNGKPRIISRRLQFIEADSSGHFINAGYAPYLDCRPPSEEEMALLDPEIVSSIPENFEDLIMGFAVAHLVPGHLDEVSSYRQTLVDKTQREVQARLTKEINYWDYQKARLEEEERAGKINAKMNSNKARHRAEELSSRLEHRMSELEKERNISPLPPHIVGGALVIPASCFARQKGEESDHCASAEERSRIEQIAMDAVMKAECSLGYVPRDVHKENYGYDIESSIPDTGKLRFIEVKGRAQGASTVTVTKNEILTAFNKPDDFILALVLVNGDDSTTKYVKRPFSREPDFGVTSINYNLNELLENARDPW